MTQKVEIQKPEIQKPEIQKSETQKLETQKSSTKIGEEIMDRGASSEPLSTRRNQGSKFLIRISF